MLYTELFYNYFVISNSIQISWTSFNSTYEEVITRLFHAEELDLNITKLPTQQKFILPYGFCQTVDFENIKNDINDDFKVNIEADTGVQIFITDKARSLHYQVAASSMIGDKIKASEIVSGGQKVTFR